jgi:multiple sugar transport system ATP-binding protein
MIAGLEEISDGTLTIEGREVNRIAPKAEIAAQLDEVAGILGLTDYLERKPADLSRGQRQCVAMGRASARYPKVFLFDEPLSNLDAKLRTQMRAKIKRLHNRLGEGMVPYGDYFFVEALMRAQGHTEFCWI